MDQCQDRQITYFVKDGEKTLFIYWLDKIGGRTKVGSKKNDTFVLDQTNYSFYMQFGTWTYDKFYSQVRQRWQTDRSYWKNETFGLAQTNDTF